MLNHLKAKSECDLILKNEAMSHSKPKFHASENRKAAPIFDCSRSCIEPFGKPKARKLKVLIAARISSSIKDLNLKMLRLKCKKI